MAGVNRLQPGLSDFGQDAGGAYHSATVYQRPNAADTAARIYAQWRALQQQYPMYTNHSVLSLMSNDQIHKLLGPKYNAEAFGGGGKETVNTDYAASSSDAHIRFLLAKELGQAVDDRTLGTPQAANAVMQAWGRPGVAPGDRPYPSGLGGGSWNGDTSNLDRQGDAVSIGGGKTTPEDAYGYQFAKSLGLAPDEPGMKPGWQSPQGFAPPPAERHLQSIGALPTPYTRPTTPQQPQANVSDLGRGVNNAPMPANPKLNAAQNQRASILGAVQRIQQQNAAGAALRSGNRGGF